MATDRRRWLGAIEAQFIGAVANGAEIVETPAFRVHLRPSPDPFYRNVAVPTRRPRDWRPAIAAMRAVFEAGGRSPRLEFLDERWPDLAAALDAAGLVEAASCAVMVVAARPATPAEAPSGLLDAAPAARLEAYLAAVQRAFDPAANARVRPGEVARLAAAIAEGRCRVAAVTDPAGGFVAGASLIGIEPPGSGAVPAAELAGVWTAPAHRGQGLASRLSTTLVDSFLAEGGGWVWLAAEAVRSAAFYAKLGFRRIGRQRNYSASLA